MPLFHALSHKLVLEQLNPKNEKENVSLTGKRDGIVL
jgi:hypothetical protein